MVSVWKRIRSASTLDRLRRSLSGDGHGNGYTVVSKRVQYTTRNSPPLLGSVRPSSVPIGYRHDPRRADFSCIRIVVRDRSKASVTVS
ncbi:hypothetical protein J6590_025423, partial [Homalodisca vitripennis]